MSKHEPGPIRAVATHILILMFRTLGWSVRQTPPRAWHALAWVLVYPLWYVSGKHRRRTLANLRTEGYRGRAARRLGIRCYHSLMVLFFESLALTNLVERKGNIRVHKEVTPEAEETLAKLARGDIPVVIALSGHIGVWEFIGAELSRQTDPARTVVSGRLPKNPILTRYLKKVRADAGIHVVEKDQFLRYMMSARSEKSPHLSVFLCDQHFKGGMRLPFRGRNACTVTVPAALALRFRAPALFGVCLRKGPGEYFMHVEILDTKSLSDLPARDAIRELTLIVNRRIEKYMEQAPEQWTWGHRRWRECCEAKEEEPEQEEQDRGSEPQTSSTQA